MALKYWNFFRKLNVYIYFKEILVEVCLWYFIELGLYLHNFELVILILQNKNNLIFMHIFNTSLSSYQSILVRIDVASGVKRLNAEITCYIVKNKCLAKNK